IVSQYLRQCTLAAYLRSARRIRHQLPRPSVPVRIAGRNIVAFERVGDVGGEEARSAIEAAAVEFEAVERLDLGELRCGFMLCSLARLTCHVIRLTNLTFGRIFANKAR